MFPPISYYIHLGQASSTTAYLTGRGQHGYLSEPLTKKQRGKEKLILADLRRTITILEVIPSPQAEFRTVGREGRRGEGGGGVREEEEEEE